MNKVLVVGGAGYIGSHMVKMLGRHGCSVTTLDELSSGHHDAVLCGDFVQGDMGERAVLDAVLSRGFDAVMHFLRRSFRWASRCKSLPSITKTTWSTR